MLNRPPPSYYGHALGASVDPRRAGTFLQASLPYTISDFESIDLVAALGEVTADPFIRHLRDIMLFNETGRRILRDRPRITSKTMSVEDLRRFPENTVGQIYAKWLEDY